MTINVFSPEGLLIVAAAILAVLCDWFPPIADRYDNLKAGPKRLWMAIALFVSAVLVLGGACTNLIPSTDTCTPSGVANLIVLLIVAIAINQGFHAGTKPA